MLNAQMKTSHCATTAWSDTHPGKWDFFLTKLNNCRQDFLTVDLLFSSNEQFTQVNNRLLSTIEMIKRCFGS
jgi:hypothetical protein